ncbi:MAG: hypothetical protein HXS54_17135 [Theionarchaea archaeon]|nr:hypothetical protein [Theionarchaea archaeon]
MDEVKLKIQKRAVPSHGRARLHTSMLSELGAQEGSKLEIINSASNKSVTVTLFADSLVEEGYIRLSAEDIEGLGLQEADTVVIRKKPPLPDAIKREAGEAADRISEGVEDIRERAGEAADRISEGVEKAGERAGVAAERISGEIDKRIGKAGEKAGEVAGTVRGEVVKAYGRFVEETAPITEKIEGATKETVSRIKEEVTPVAERVEGAAREAYQRIAESPLKERVSKATESFIDKLKPGEEVKLKEILEGCEGDIRAVTVTSDIVADKLVKELDLPQEVVISAVQRNKEIIIPKGETRLVRGDIVYLVGKGESLRECTELMEG